MDFFILIIFISWLIFIFLYIINMTLNLFFSKKNKEKIIRLSKQNNNPFFTLYYLSIINFKASCIFLSANMFMFLFLYYLWNWSNL